jgi:hypothetical protein
MEEQKEHKAGVQGDFSRSLLCLIHAMEQAPGMSQVIPEGSAYCAHSLY